MTKLLRLAAEDYAVTPTCPYPTPRGGIRRCFVLAIAALAAVLLLGGTGCNRGAGAAVQSEETRTSSAPAAVTLVRPQRQTIRHRIEQPGQIQAFEQTPLYVKIPGYVHKVNVDIGDRVRGPRHDSAGNVIEPGQVLAQLWVPEVEEEVKHKEALVRQARAELEQTHKLLDAAEAQVESAEAFLERWRLEHERLEKLARPKAGIIDQQTVDETRHQWQAARARRNESQARRDKARLDIRVAEVRIEVAEADHRRQAALLQYATVRAPFDGVVAQRGVDTGHYLQPASGGSKGEPLFVVVRVDPVRIYVDVAEVDAVGINETVAARVRVQALKDLEFAGKVARSAWVLAPTTRTLRTAVDLENSHGKLRPGMYALATLWIEHPQVWTLPAAAVVTRDDETYCFCVKEGKACRTPLKLGVRAGAVVEVLKKQARPARPGELPEWEDPDGAEHVIADSSGALTDGQLVGSGEKP